MTEDELYAEIEPLAQSLRLDLVDCRMQQTRFGVVVQLVVYRSTGLGTDDCAKLHRLVAPRLELLFDNKDLKLEVSSPGLDRKFRTRREYSIFKNRSVHVVCKDGKEYRGILLEADVQSCSIKQGELLCRLQFDDIAKVKLDYMKEEITP
jgi:ribosome maturation factor RimP